MTDTVTTETVDLEALATEWAETQERLAKAEASYLKRTKKDRDRLTEIESLIARNAPIGDNVFGSKQVRVTPTVKVDKDKLKETFPMDEHPDLWTHDISATKVQNRIGKDEYSRYQIPTGKTKLTINDTL